MSKLSLVEKSILFLVAVILLTGFILFYNDVTVFETYVREDGIVEWLTVLGLLLGCGVCLARFIRLRKHRTTWFLFVTLILAIFQFFAAGEEISWGQRIFGIKSSEFFLEKNTQGETNLHNLIVDGVKLNQVIFSIGLIAALGIYLLLMPYLHRRNKKLSLLIDRSGIPVPRIYQVISIIVLFLLTELIRHGKRAELLEAGITLLFFLIIRYPQNSSIFNKDNNLQRDKS
jgi:hypothetical protein